MACGGGRRTRRGGGRHGCGLFVVLDGLRRAFGAVRDVAAGQGEEGLAEVGLAQGDVLDLDPLRNV
jgi:hypothetical protein